MRWSLRLSGHWPARPQTTSFSYARGSSSGADAIDRLHTGTPHQLDLWRICRKPMTDPISDPMNDPMSDRDMDQMISALAGALVPGADYRTEARVHSYTRTAARSTSTTTVNGSRSGSAGWHIPMSLEGPASTRVGAGSRSAWVSTVCSCSRRRFPTFARCDRPTPGSSPR